MDTHWTSVGQAVNKITQNVRISDIYPFRSCRASQVRLADCPDRLFAFGGDGVVVENVERFPCSAAVFGDIGTVGADGDQSFLIDVSDAGTIAVQTRTCFPGFAAIGRECGKVLGHRRFFVIAADDDAVFGIVHRDGENAAAGGAFCYRRFGGQPAFAAVIGSKTRASIPPEIRKHRFSLRDQVTFRLPQKQLHRF